MKQLLITINLIILFSYYAISQEQNDSVSIESSKERGYYFGLTYDYSLLRTNQLVQERIYWIDDHLIPILNSNSFFVKGTYSPYYVALTSLHNLNKDWDIGFKIGFLITSNEASFGATGEGNITAQDRLWTSLLIATYGYYYPFDENRYFIRFGLDNNIYVSSKFFESERGRGASGLRSHGLIYIDKRNFRTSLSLGLGYYYNDRVLLNIGIAISFRNEYGYYQIR